MNGGGDPPQSTRTFPLILDDGPATSMSPRGRQTVGGNCPIAAGGRPSGRLRAGISRRNWGLAIVKSTPNLVNWTVSVERASLVCTGPPRFGFLDLRAASGRTARQTGVWARSAFGTFEAFLDRGSRDLCVDSSQRAIAQQVNGMTSILVVDDSATDRRMVGGLLERHPEFEVEYAEDGMDALRKMERSRPDIVVTDINMPVKNGLELVTATRVHFSGVPVILITAQGSEAIAVQALEEGAASYVPKVQLSEKLVDTVEEVLAIAHAQRSYERLIGSIDRSEFEMTLENDAALFDPLVDLFQNFVHGMGLCDETGRFRVGMALKEALLNALYRGNLEIDFEQTRDVRDEIEAGREIPIASERRRAEPYATRRIHLKITLDPGQAVFVIRDDGPGFDAGDLPAPGDLSALHPDTGRGIVLMRAFMDEVNYNERGNEVTMIKRRP